VQNHATIHNRGAGLEAKIEIIRPVQPLHRLQILRIQLWDVHEDIAIYIDAVLILMSRTTVFGESRELPPFQ